MCVFVESEGSVTVNSEFWTFRPALVILSQILGVRVAPHLNSTNSLRISVNKIVQAFRSSCRAPSLFEQKLASEFPVAGTEKLWEYISLCKKVLCWQDCHRSAKTKAQEVVRTVFSCSIIRVREKHCWPSEVAELVIRSSCVVSFSCFSFVTPGRFRLLFPFQLLALAIVSWFCLFRAEEIKTFWKTPLLTEIWSHNGDKKNRLTENLENPERCWNWQHSETKTIVGGPFPKREKVTVYRKEAGVQKIGSGCGKPSLTPNSEKVTKPSDWLSWPVAEIKTSFQILLLAELSLCGRSGLVRVLRFYLWVVVRDSKWVSLSLKGTKWGGRPQQHAVLASQQVSSRENLRLLSSRKGKAQSRSRQLIPCSPKVSR